MTKKDTSNLPVEGVGVHAGEESELPSGRTSPGSDPGVVIDLVPSDSDNEPCIVQDLHAGVSNYDDFLSCSYLNVISGCQHDAPGQSACSRVS